MQSDDKSKSATFDFTESPNSVKMPLEHDMVFRRLVEQVTPIFLEAGFDQFMLTTFSTDMNIYTTAIEAQNIEELAGLLGNAMQTSQEWAHYQASKQQDDTQPTQ